MIRTPPPRKISIREKTSALKSWASRLKNTSEAAEALRKIQHEKLYLGDGFENFKEYLDHIGITYLKAYRMIKDSKVAQDVSMAKRFTDRGGYLYIIGCDGFIKIGLAQNPAKRITDMQVSNPHKLKLLKIFPVGNMIKSERQLHGIFKKYRVRGEWFKVPAESLEKILKAKLLAEILSV